MKEMYKTIQNDIKDIKMPSLVRRWTLDSLVDESKVDSNKIILSSLLPSEPSESEQNKNSNDEQVLISERRESHIATLAIDLQKEIVLKIIASKLFISIGLLTTQQSSKEFIENFVATFFEELPHRYLLTVDIDSAIQHMKLRNIALKSGFSTVSCQLIDNITVITIICRDKAKLYRRISTALDRVCSNIIDADIMTSTTGYVS